MPQAWVIRALRADDYETVAFTNGIMSVGWPAAGDLSSYSTLPEMRVAIRAMFPFVERQSADSYATQLFGFSAEITEGDAIVQLRRRSPDVAIGWVAGPYAYRTDLGDDIRHTRIVNWARLDLPRSLLEAELLRLPTPSMLHRVGDDRVVNRIRKLVNAPTPQQAEAVELADGAVVSPSSDAEPLLTLRRNLNYARNLATAGQHLQHLQLGAFEIEDVFRAAWVQSVAALDHWVRQELRARLLKLASQTGDSPKPKGFASFPLTLGQLQRVLADDLSLMDAIDEQLSATRGHLAYQHPDKIREAFALVSDVQRLWDRVANALSEQAGEVGRNNGSDVRARLIEIVSRRNKIAHEYDEDPANLPKKRPIDAGAVTETVDWIEQVVAALAEVLDKAERLTA